MRLIWMLIGLLSLGLGVVGAVLPLLPTTPFLLLATYAFARSSEKLLHWLLGHPWLGPFIDNWQRYGAIPLHAKWTATGMLILVLLISIAVGVRPLVILVQSLALIGVAAFLYLALTGQI